MFGKVSKKCQQVVHIIWNAITSIGRSDNAPIDPDIVQRIGQPGGLQPVMESRISVFSGFDGDRAEISCVYTGKSIDHFASSLVTVTARNPYDALYRQLISDQKALAGRGIDRVERIGDCRAPGIIAAAVYAGHRVAREMDAPDPGDVSFRRERVTV